MTARLGSLLIGSSNVEEMKRWYRRAFDATENQMGAFEIGSVQVFIEPHSDVSGPAKEPARCIINFDVDDAWSLADHLRDMGTRFVREVEAAPFGVIATAADPDGNYLQIIQWGGTPEAHRDV
jgi:predicted enzyme related to lactoylglutathione lyase